MKSRKEYTIENLEEYKRKTKNEKVKKILAKVIEEYSSDKPEDVICLLAHVISEVYTANRAFILYADSRVLTAAETAENIRNGVNQNGRVHKT